MKNVAHLKHYCFICVFVLILLPTTGCDEDENNPKQAKAYTSEVVKEWLGVQTSMLYVPTGNPFGFNPSRYMAYCGIALYESVVPGMPAYQTLHGQLTDMPAMPVAESGAEYHWPTCANAALATMTQKFFSPVTAVYNEAAVVALRDELNTQYRTEVSDAVVDRSIAFGEEVANRIFEWAKTDNAGWPTSYTIPTGDGVWKS